MNVWDFSGLKDMFQVFDQFVILSKSEEEQDATACLSEGGGISGQIESGVISKKMEVFPVSEIIDGD